MHTQNPFKILGLGAAIVILALNVPLTKITAQENQSAPPPVEYPARYNFEEFAINLTLKVGKEAANLSSPADRIEVQLEAARILSPVRKDDALRLLDSAWNTLKEWNRNEEQSSRPSRPQLRARLRNDILASYSKLDPERASNLVKNQNAASSESDEANKEEARKNVFITKERQRADDLAKIGLAQIERNPSEGVETAISGLLQTGEVSDYLSLMAQTLREKGRENLLKEFESKVAAILVQRSGLNAFDISSVVGLINANARMQGTTRLALLKFLTNSLARLSETIKQARNAKQPLSIDIDTVDSLYTIYVRNVRPLVASYNPDKINNLNLLIDEIASTLPPSVLDSVYETSTTDAPDEQLSRARNTNNSELRNVRLARFALRALNGALPGAKGRQPALAAIAVDAINASEIKTILQDYILMADVERLSKESNYGMAVEKASAISKLEWHAWTLFALASAQAGGTLAVLCNYATMLCAPLKKVSLLP